MYIVDIRVFVRGFALIARKLLSTTVTNLPLPCMIMKDNFEERPHTKD
jgi:hypothetical protein